MLNEINVKKVQPLSEYEKNREIYLAPSWVKENTAILVIHGIGHQQPIETLDQFSRGIIERYQKLFPGLITFEHKLETLDFIQLRICMRV